MAAARFRARSRSCFGRRASARSTSSGKNSRRKVSGQFGSGWVWLEIKDGKAAIRKTRQRRKSPRPRLRSRCSSADVWEHSYYIDYRNRRADYLKAFLEHLVNWEHVEEMLEAPQSKRRPRRRHYRAFLAFPERAGNASAVPRDLCRGSRERPRPRRRGRAGRDRREPRDAIRVSPAMRRCKTSDCPSPRRATSSWSRRAGTDARRPSESLRAFRFGSHRTPAREPRRIRSEYVRGSPRISSTARRADSKSKSRNRSRSPAKPS